MKIVHYSGTGNSAHMAHCLSQRMGIEEVSLNEVFRSGEAVDLDDDELVFVAPTYCWRLPRVVSDWMERRGFRQGQKAWFVMTCGDDFGNAERYLLRTCKRSGLECMGGIEIVMPENYITMFHAPSAELSRTIIECGEMAVEEVALCLERHEHFPERPVSLRDRLFSGPTNGLFFRFIVKDRKFWVRDSCVGCGLCEEVCPMNNVRLREGRPTWQGHCTHCMACICRCPQGAIEYGNATTGKRRHCM